MAAPPPLPPLTSIATTRSSASPPPADLRHMQSNSVLVSPGSSNTQKDRSNRYSGITIGGSRSPTSIPSSPTSVHSSSSAIFERDIEPLSSPSPPATALHPPNPHRIPRAKATETLESSVPSVLDSAAEILANLSDSEGVSVEAPAINSASARINSGWASPVLFRSRSPSPGGGERKSLLLSIPQQQSPKERHPTPPSLITPTSAYFSTSSSADGSPPVTTTRERVPSLPSASPTSGYASLVNANASTVASPTSTTSASGPNPPSPTQVSSTKRLSFMSYNDLLISTPASTLPLSLLTSSVVGADPPPHIPALSNAALGGYSSPSSGGGPASSISVSGSTTASLRGFPIDPTSLSLNPTMGKNRDSIVLLDEVGGEWEREGLGRGLEERLEGLLNVKG